MNKNEIKIPIAEIMSSIEGEGDFQGKPATFIRIPGCSINCSWCDTTFAQNTKFKKYSTEYIVDKVSALQNKFVSITGGNPFENKQTYKLIQELKNSGFTISIEHPGVVKNLKYELKIIKIVDFISFDLKPPSAKVKYRIEDLINLLNSFSKKPFQFKGVIKDIEDLKFYKKKIPYLIKKVDKVNRSTFYLHPCCEENNYNNLNSNIITKVIKAISSKNSPDNIRLGCQLHKVLNVK